LESVVVSFCDDISVDHSTERGEGDTIGVALIGSGEERIERQTDKQRGRERERERERQREREREREAEMGSRKKGYLQTESAGDDEKVAQAERNDN
jgi:hypothetical protein